MATTRLDLARIAFAIFFLVALVGTSIWILRPFLPAVIWATTLVTATWPLMLLFQGWLWRKRSLAVTVMTLLLLLVFVVPLWAAIDMIVRYAGQLKEWAEAVTAMELPSPPTWLERLPVIGDPAARFWHEMVETDFHDLLQRAKPYAGVVTQWLIAALGDVGYVFVQFLLTVAFSAVMYTHGEGAAAAITGFTHRLAGERGVRSARLAAQAIRSVALGVVVTAIVQATIGCLGLLVTGVPFGGLLSAVTFVFCVAQLGPGPVLIPAVIWMYFNRDPLWASVLLAFSVAALTLDNVLRPILIRRGADLPLLLILIGVIGGLLAFGLIGMFIGPTVLAVTYTLAKEWISEDDEGKTSERS
jgi:predicted PurR-regulated permease PerM